MNWFTNFSSEATSYKTPDVEPLILHLINNPGITESTCRTILESKDKIISDVLLWTPTHGHTSVGQVANTDIYQIYVDTWRHLGNISRAMADREGWRKKEREREKERDSERESKASKLSESSMMEIKSMAGSAIYVSSV